MVVACLEEQVERYATEYSIDFVWFKWKHQINISTNSLTHKIPCAFPLRFQFND